LRRRLPHGTGCQNPERRCAWHGGPRPAQRSGESTRDAAPLRWHQSGAEAAIGAVEREHPARSDRPAAEDDRAAAVAKSDKVKDRAGLLRVRFGGNAIERRVWSMKRLSPHGSIGCLTLRFGAADS